jgi:hypothetical protein
MDLELSRPVREHAGPAQGARRQEAGQADSGDTRALRPQPDGLVGTLARIIVAIERRRALQVIEGGQDMRTSTENGRAR